MCDYSHQLFARKHMDISQEEVTCQSLLGVKGLNGPLQNQEIWGVMEGSAVC